MPVYLVVFTAHPADEGDRENHRAQLRAAGFQSIIERRFAPEDRRQVSATCYFVDTAEPMATLTAFSEPPDELYVLPVTGPLIGRSPVQIDTHAWLAERLRSSSDDIAGARELGEPLRE